MRILIDNAIKHTQDEATIKITTSSNADTATVEVADDGPGIPEEHIERIFERFHTADSGAGSGLGLAISRELSRLMGGDLSVASRPGRTTFTLTLPAVSGPVEAAAAGSSL